MKEKLNKISEALYKRAVQYSRKTYLFDINLTGMCAIASAWALEILKKEKIKAEAVVVINKNSGEGHVFILINKTHILDITYTQFNPKHKSWILFPVNKRKENHPDKDVWFWSLKGKKTSDVEKFKKHLRKIKWAVEQIP
jgi:hypothetical protein